MDEDTVIEKLTKTIDDKIEFSVTMKMSGITKWIIGTVVTVIAMFIVVLLSNSYYMGKMDAQYASVLKYIEAQNVQNAEIKKLNKTLSSELEETEANQMVILANMKRLDPTFTMPFQLRGATKNRTN